MMRLALSALTTALAAKGSQASEWQKAASQSTQKFNQFPAPQSYNDVTQLRKLMKTGNLRGTKYPAAKEYIRKLEEKEYLKGKLRTPINFDQQSNFNYILHIYFTLWCVLSNDAGELI